MNKYTKTLKKSSSIQLHHRLFSMNIVFYMQEEPKYIRFLKKCSKVFVFYLPQTKCKPKNNFQQSLVGIGLSCKPFKMLSTAKLIIFSLVSLVADPIWGVRKTLGSLTSS